MPARICRDEMQYITLATTSQLRIQLNICEHFLTKLRTQIPVLETIQNILSTTDLLTKPHIQDLAIQSLATIPDKDDCLVSTFISTPVSLNAPLS